ncbi:hypothetical protein C8R43DRAFT_964452 [Mycena crocata]|nr:hypothetical protein C8R43DRAFT_964452 [Mycena crocata]
MSVGRKNEAHLILNNYHGNGNSTAPSVILECREFKEAIKLNALNKPWQGILPFPSLMWDYTGLFNTGNARYRTFIVLFMACCAQWSEVAYSSTASKRDTDAITQNLRFILSLVSSILAAIGGLCGAAISDKSQTKALQHNTLILVAVGRRTHWFWGNLCCTVCTALYGAGGNDPAGFNTAIAFLFLFNFLFCATYLPLPAAYPSECMSFENRSTFVASGASLINTMATPVALPNIQWRLYCVFIAWDLVACVLIWLFVVETFGRTLEERNDIFEAPHPVKASRKPQRMRPTVIDLIPVVQRNFGFNRIHLSSDFMLPA